jgi:putative membrane protein
LWFLRGLADTTAAERPPIWRRLCFLFGLATIYIVLQTRFDYFAQHMFFLSRVQHVVMHHLGPFLIALGGAGAAIRRGMPHPLRRLIDSRPVTATIRFLQQPVVAVALFLALFYVWLIPAVQFRAMIDPRVYLLMNWSMTADGLLFWPMVLDRRPSPPARLSFGARAAMAYATTFPEILIGAFLTSLHRDLYPYYTLCGRLFPSITAMADQRIGAIITWVVPSMMSAEATVLVVWTFLRQEQAETARRERH